MKAMFTVFGTPQGKERPRMTKRGHTYTPEKTREYENLVKAEYDRQCKGRFFGEVGELKMPIKVYIAAYFNIPKSFTKGKKSAAEYNIIRPTKKPDSDNIAKVICDALNGVAYLDDTQVVHLVVDKLYTAEKERVYVEIESLIDKDEE